MNIDSMIQGNPQALVTSYNGVLVADSLQVADSFGKAHKNVVRDIENLMAGIEANRLNFEPIAEKEYFIPDFYTDKRNREQKRYKLTRDGFSLLVMGFTGPAALHWKLLYIEAFNKMEQALRSNVDIRQLVTQITTDVLRTVLPDIRQAVEPPPEIEDGRVHKRAVTAETPCRVRAILSGNAPKGKRLSDYAQGAESLKDVFNNEDIRRFDFAIFMRSTDVDPEKYNRSLPSFPRTMSDDALKNNVLFAWSRTPEQVVFLPDTVDAILETATKLSKVYGNATDIPLVSPSDQRNKVARLAVALASLTHSVDESGERITVYPAHVNFIYDYLVQLYNAPGCGLNYYARLAVSEEIVGDKFDKITNELRKLDTLKGASKYNEFIDLFARQKYLRLGDVEAMLSIEKEEAKAIINQCVRLRMLTMTSGGYRKTPRFNSYISKCFEMGLFDHMENDI